MPTINEVWEQAQQINANLATIHGDLTTVHNDLTTIHGDLTTANGHLANLSTKADTTNAWLQDLRVLTAQGFASLSAGLVAMHARQDATNALLVSLIEHQVQANCLLEQISRNTCGIWNEASLQTPLHEDSRDAALALEHMFGTVHPDGALHWARAEEDRMRLEECCPPDEPDPACKREECRAPKKAPRPQAPGYTTFEPPKSGVKSTSKTGKPD